MRVIAYVYTVHNSLLLKTDSRLKNHKTNKQKSKTVRSRTIIVLNKCVLLFLLLCFVFGYIHRRTLTLGKVIYLKDIVSPAWECIHTRLIQERTGEIYVKCIQLNLMYLCNLTAG